MQLAARREEIRYVSGQRCLRRRLSRASGRLSPLHAQSTVYMPAVLELSGAGAVSGTNFRDGMLMAIEEINAKGGILGKKIDMPLLDTQSEAGVSRAADPESARQQTLRDPRPGVLRIGAGRHAAHASTPKFRKSSAARRPRSRRRTILTCSAPRSASNSACRRSPTTCATASRPRRRRHVGQQRFRQRRP